MQNSSFSIDTPILIVHYLLLPLRCSTTASGNLGRISFEKRMNVLTFKQRKPFHNLKRLSHVTTHNLLTRYKAKGFDHVNEFGSISLCIDAL